MKAIQNPIIPTDESGRTWDPQVVFYNGWYYHCYQKKENGVFLARARDIADLANAEELNVFAVGKTSFQIGMLLSCIVSMAFGTFTVRRFITISIVCVC